METLSKKTWQVSKDWVTSVKQDMTSKLSSETLVNKNLAGKENFVKQDLVAEPESRKLLSNLL